MKDFVVNIETKTLKNEFFREVLSTTQHCQVVVMSLLPSEQIGMEVHPVVDQFIRVEKGEGIAILHGKEFALSDGSALVVPAGTVHNIINTSKENSLKLYTLYSPHHHKEGTIHKTKKAALADKGDHL